MHPPLFDPFVLATRHSAVVAILSVPGDREHLVRFRGLSADDRRRRVRRAAGLEGRLRRAPRQVRGHQRVRLRLRAERPLVAAGAAARGPPPRERAGAGVGPATAPAVALAEAEEDALLLLLM